MKITAYQLSEMIRKLAGQPKGSNEESDPVACLVQFCNEGSFRLPFNPEDVFWIEERLPVFSDIKHPAQSVILGYLNSNVGMTGLVVDAHLSGGEAIFVVCWADLIKLSQWLPVMNEDHMGCVVQSALGGVLMLASLKSFVV